MDNDYVGQTASHAQPGELHGDPAESHPPRDLTRQATEAESGMEALLRDNEYAFRSLRRGETVEGTVVRVDQDEVLVDVGLKSEGIIPSRELYSEGDDEQPLHIGDRALVYVMHPEGHEGHAILSLRRARMERSWRDIEELYHRGAIVEAPVVDFNKGGLIVDVKGVRGFVPVSQVLDLRNVSRQEGEDEEVTQTLLAMKGRRLPLKIIEINRSRNRLILSERAAVQERRTQLKDELMDQLQPGQIRRGVVSNLTSFGAFVDLGGADGLVHVSELSYNRVNHPSEILQVGQEIDVYVLSVDRERKKIALSLKRALPDPWTTVDERYRVGQVVSATITKLAKFGAFAKVEEGLEGLIHLSELTDLPVQDAAQVVQEGQEVDVKIIHINSQRRRLGLSVRQAVEPLGDYQSFGELDETSAFAAHELGSPDFASETSVSAPLGQPPHPTPSDEYLDETETSPQLHPGLGASSFVPENETPAGEQDSPAAESEPEAQAIDVNGSTAAAPEEASPASPEASLPNQEEDETPVASAAPKGSVSD
jgi:small subunit ribosomal protein S1